jgi:hypothetical protein
MLKQIKKNKGNWEDGTYPASMMPINPKSALQ